MWLFGRGALLPPWLGNKMDPFVQLVALLGFCAVVGIANLVLAALILGMSKK